MVKKLSKSASNLLGRSRSQAGAVGVAEVPAEGSPKRGSEDSITEGDENVKAAPL